MILAKHTPKAILGWPLFFLLISACGAKPEKVQRQNYGPAQGSTYQVSYITSPGTDYQTSIDSLLFSVDMSLSAWKEQSTLSRVNRGDTVLLSNDLQFAAVLDSSMAMHQRSQGLFDISLGRLVQLWGFYRKNSLPPTDSLVQAALASVSLSHIHIHNDSLWLSDSCLLDVNGIAQGYTVDRLAAFFEARGIEEYMVEVGGEVRCRGRNIDENIWRIGIDKPTDEALEDRFQRIISLDNRSLATSGNYRKYIEDPETGERYGHSLDPKTGYPNRDVLLSASVVCGNATAADAWGTALMVAGFERAKELVESTNGVEAYLIYSDRNGEWKEWWSEGFPDKP